MFITPSLGQNVNLSCATGLSGDCSDLITGFCQTIQGVTVRFLTKFLDQTLTSPTTQIGQLNTVSQCFNRVNGTKCM
jgi:hypothetical protein